jgi:hypothetical protein
MSHTSIDYKSVLADLMTRRAKLDAAIAAIEEFTSHNGNELNSQPKHVLPLHREYRGMTIAAAAIKFLKEAGHPQLTRTIADALRVGGISSNSRNLYRTLYNTLNNRMDKHQDITKEGAKWGLSEWQQHAE